MRKFAIICVLCMVHTAAAQEMSDTLHPVTVTHDGRLYMPVQGGDRIGVKSLADILGRDLTDKIMHPFAFRRRQRERHRRKMMKILREYEQTKTPNELLIEALRREGIDPDSLKR